MSVEAGVETADTVIREVMRLVRSELSADHSLASMASRAYMSSRSFTRHFRRVTGSSPYSWLLDQRMARAQELLADPALRIEDIAQLAGFDGAGMMRRHFQRVLGCTPSEFRARASAVRG